MADWADEKAREWYRSIWARAPQDALDQDCPSLAALLREVAENAHDDICAKMARAERSALLAKVRRVVEQAASDVRLACISTTESDAVGALRGALLSRLDKL